jgi:hypothetical protein
LLDAYVGRMLTRDINSRAYFQNKTPNATKTRMWLVWLAQQLQKKSKTEFLIEEVQPSCFKSNAHKRIHKLIYGLILGLIVDLTIGLVYKLLEGEIHFMLEREIYEWLIVSLTLGLIFGLIAGQSLSEIQLAEKIIFPEFSTKNQLIGALIGAPIGALIGMLGYRYANLLFEVRSNLPIETKRIPNQGIWKSATNAAFVCLNFLLYWELLWVLSFWLFGLKEELKMGLKEGLKMGLLSGVSFGMIYGGSACLNHFCLRLVLYFNGYIPWNYARFLDYCTERLFLQRVGGRYRFIHKMLQDHFAKMPFDRIVD